VSRMNLSQETCLELNSSFSGKNDDCSGVAPPFVGGVCLGTH